VSDDYSKQNESSVLHKSSLDNGLVTKANDEGTIAGIQVQCFPGQREKDSEGWY